MLIKIIKLFCCLLLICTTAWSQKNEFNVLYKEEKILGKNLIDGTDIKGIEIIFPERIHKAHIDTTTNHLTLHLRELRKNGKKLKKIGNILQYDIENKNILWNKRIDYQIDKPEQFGNFLLVNKYCIDMNTGEYLWDAKHDIYLVDLKKNIGIGYRYGTWGNDRSVLEGINLKNGRTIWKREIDRKYGWNNTFSINDSTLIIVSSGIHEVNIYTGKGWDYDAITGKIDYYGSGYGVVGLVSNILFDSAFMYFASKEELVRLNKQSGKVVWKFLFRHDLMTKSSIFMNDSVVYMINKGFAFALSGQFNLGRVFIAAFNRQTGEQKYVSYINYENNPVKEFQLLDNELYLLFRKTIVKYNIETGTQISEKEFWENDYGRLRFFAGSQVFVNNQDDDFYNLLQNDLKKLHLYTTKNKIVSIDNQLNVTNTIDFDDVGIYYLRFMDYRFIAKDNKTFIINKEGKKIAELDVSSNAFLMDNVLYDTRNRSFIAIDLKNIKSLNLEP